MLSRSGVSAHVRYEGKNGTALAVAKPLVVRPLEEADFARWDEFVLAHTHGSPFHLIAWKKTIEETFGYQPFYLVAADEQQIYGVLPLFLVENILVRKALISSPFAVYGGILAGSTEARDALRDAVSALGDRLGVQYVELRNGHEEQAAGFSRISRYVTFQQQIGPDEAALLQTIPRKTRRIVRKSLQEGFRIVRQKQDVRAFESLYCRNLTRLGTPCFPSEYFANLLANFREMADIREVMLEERVVATVLSFYFRNQVLPYYGASEPAYNAQAPSSFMYFDMMRSTGADGFTLFDFGRSKKHHGGSYDFKAHWGMVERELPYEMLLVRRKQLPNFSPMNPVFRLPIRMWQRMPVWLARLVGPRLIRLVP